MSVRPLVTAPNAILRTKSQPVVLDKKLLDFEKDLGDSLLKQDHPKGVGLAAPQIGKNWRVFATLLPKHDDEDPTPADLRFFYNPLMKQMSEEMTLGPDPEDPILEGCLSIPHLYGPVSRSAWVILSYEENIGGQLVQKEERFTDFAARVIQHEYDHIEGILFIDHSRKQQQPIYEQRGRRMVEIDPDLVKLL